MLLNKEKIFPERAGDKLHIIERGWLATRKTTTHPHRDSICRNPKPQSNVSCLLKMFKVS